MFEPSKPNRPIQPLCGGDCPQPFKSLDNWKNYVRGLAHSLVQSNYADRRKTDYPWNRT